MHHRAVADQHIFACNISHMLKWCNGRVCMHAYTHLVFKELIVVCVCVCVCVCVHVHVCVSAAFAYSVMCALKLQLVFASTLLVVCSWGGDM